MRHAFPSSAASVTTREKAPTILTAEGARRLTAAIRNDLAAADAKLVRAFEGRIWEVSSPPRPSFEAWCAAEIPELQHISLRRGPRRERAKMLLEQGATEREIAAATGSSVGTAHNDVVALTQPPVLKNEQAECPVTAPPASLSTVARAVALVAAQGSRGLTVKELGRETGWHHGQASGALSRAERRGLIRRVPTFRDRCAAYIKNP